MPDKINFTAGRIANFSCPPDKKQAFLWDSNTNGLGLRRTPAGKPSYIYQSRYNNKTIRITIGSPNSWTIPDARDRAREIQRQIDKGQDPRIIKKTQNAADQATREKQTKLGVTVGALWNEYLKTRKDSWAASTYKDHKQASQKGGVERKRWKGKKTKPGTLSKLMPVKIEALNPKLIEKIIRGEAKKRPARTRLALRMFRTFLRWLNDQKEYDIDPQIAGGNELRRIAGKPKAKSDHLLKEQLPVWFSYTKNIQNPVISAYLQCLLLTGARRNELLSLKWSDVDQHWKSISLHDKVEDDRKIPLTPFVEHLISTLPKRNTFVFSSPTSKSGQLIDPSIAHRSACAAAELEVTLHGLRRSFKSLSEWLEIPVGVIAQIMGHKPSATAERHYTVRPFDLLRIHHERFEKFIIEQAGLEIPSAEEGLQLIEGGGR